MNVVGKADIIILVKCLAGVQVQVESSIFSKVSAVGEIQVTLRTCTH